MGATALPWSARHAAAENDERPNILWISVEDISPDLGCYGDRYSVTPNIDRFATQAVRYQNAFVPMGVCAPCRSGIITGMYPTSIGTNNMRSRGVPPVSVRCFPEYLRAAGYYCTNRSKTDYQFEPPFTAWDGSKGDWRGRAEGQPFFSVINLGTTHEGQIRNQRRREQAAQQLSAQERHDPAKAQLPPYYPDTPIVRRDWAQYYDNITMMDKEVAAILKALDDDGLAEDTIVWFWGDHGRGLPRGKRWIYDSGLRAPLIIRVPERWRRWVSKADPDAVAPGTVTDELVSFIDFGPTVLSLCGVPVPEQMQGRPFLGSQKASSREYVYGARDRVDEAYDMIRAVRDKRFKYIRNFMAHLPRSLDIAYMNLMPTMQEMRRLYAEGKLHGPQLQYFERPKPVEELYDIQADPHEVHNLAGDPRYRSVLERMRAELFRWMGEVGDFGLLTEAEFDSLKRPNDEYEVTSAPGVRVRPEGDGYQVELLCNTPGASLGYRIVREAAIDDEDGLVLPVGEAEMHGKGAHRKNGEVTGWRDRNTWFAWQADVRQTGTLPVHLLQAYARRDPGKKYTVAVGDQQLSGVGKRTGGWGDYQFVHVGDVHIDKPGRYSVSIKPQPGSEPFSLNIRAIVIGAKRLPRQMKGGKNSRWLLYSRPFVLSKGQTIEARAIRLGFRASETVRYHAGGELVEPAPAKVRPHWREIVDRSGVIDRALALKKLDGQPERAIPAYERCLSGATRDPAGAVRYWAVLGLHTRAFTVALPNHDKRTRVDLVRAALEDPSPVVRIAAAQAMCDWGEAKTALPVLVEAMKHPQGTVRLYAITALSQIGEAAMEAVEVIRQARKDKLGYVQRQAQHALRYLGVE